MAEGRQSNLPEAAKEVLRHEPDAEGITSGAGICRKLMADLITKHPGEAGGEQGGSGNTKASGEGLGAHAAPGSAAAGMVPGRHAKDFETRTNEMAQGAETPDGPVQQLALHHEQGQEGSGSKADKKMGEFIHTRQG